MLRIWGGAIFEPRAFYDAADEFGVLMCEWPTMRCLLLCLLPCVRARITHGPASY